MINQFYQAMRISSLFLLFFLPLQGSSGQINSGGSEADLKLIYSIPLPNVNGRIDHLAYNGKAGLLYIAALGNNTVEVADLKAKKVIYTIKGLKEPQGIRYISEGNVIFVANGENGECDIFNADTYKKTTSIKLDGDADNVRYDPSSGNIYVGYGEGGIAVIDARTFKKLSNVKLPGHPESFQLDTELKKLYVNVPDAHILEKIDLNTNEISDTWRIDVASANFPMAVDGINHRLFIGCRRPAKMLVINSETGKTLATVDIDGDTDDLFYNNSSGKIYVSCGAGFIDVIKQTGPDNYQVISKLESRSGARTSLYVPELKQLFVAVPARSGNEARLLIFQAK